MSKHRYQLVVVFAGSATSQEATVKKVLAWFKANDLSVVEDKKMGTIELAYPIAKQKKGDFWVWEVEADKAVAANSLRVMLDREKEVIRYLILKK